MYCAHCVACVLKFAINGYPNVNSLKIIYESKKRRIHVAIQKASDDSSFLWKEYYYRRFYPVRISHLTHMYQETYNQ